MFDPNEEKYFSAVQGLERRGVMPKTAPSVEKTRRALEKLRLQIDPQKVILVAGTNGKGSVSACLESLLRSAGKSTGLYTSPHLVNTTERIRINGKDIDRMYFSELYEELEIQTQGMQLTHFEMLTLMAVTAFQRRGLEYSILEVGLGGLWDATNAIPHAICVITPIAKDHSHILGNELMEIARNKFGIVPEYSFENLDAQPKVIHAKFSEEISSLVQETQSRTRSHWIPSCEVGHTQKETARGIQTWVDTPWGKTSLNLPGKRGAENAALALTTFKALGFEPSSHLGALSQVNWPGRMELVSLQSGQNLYLSGDHNPAGIESLLEILKGLYRFRRKIHLLVGFGQHKDFDQMLKLLTGHSSHRVYLTETPFQGLKLHEYGDWVSRVEGAWASPLEALKNVLSHSKAQDRIVVTGSIYLVGEVKGLLESQLGRMIRQP